MFKMTKAWLRKNYGSANPGQVKQSREWLQRFGKNVPDGVLDEWGKWKHLIEYQVNTEDIVAQALSKVDTEFSSELQAHRFINLMRVPLAKTYEQALEIVKPTTVLELGVGGDSAISTAVFLAWLEGVPGGHLTSVERNRLGTTWIRYGHVSHWKFVLGDSVKFLTDQQMVCYDMVFIDTIHSYSQTMKELELSSNITSAILCDDIQFEGNPDDSEPGGVKRAWEEWTSANTNWEPLILHNNVGLLKKKPKRILKRRSNE